MAKLQAYELQDAGIDAVNALMGWRLLDTPTPGKAESR